MEMLEANYRTWCAQNDVAVEDGPSDVNVAEVDMEIDAEPQTVDDGERAGPDNEERDNDEGDEDKEEEWGGIMDVDDIDTPSFFQDELNDKAKKVNATSGPSRKRKGKVAELVREKARRVLEDETGLADKRARMCDESDFLRLLWAFNKEGIHFS